MSIDLSEMPARLEVMLKKRLPNARTISVTDFERMTGGYSRVMSKFTATIDGETKRFVSRADAPPGQSLFDTDRVQEWEVLSALTKDGRAPMPKALFFDADGSELGEKTIILEFIEGEPFIAPLRRTGEEARAAQAAQLCDLLASIHSVTPEVLPASMQHRGDWNSYVDSLIAKWRQTEREHVERDPFFRYMASWLEDNKPEPLPLALVHGEFQISNTVLNADGRLLAVDWEFTHVGDPREDLGWCKWVGAMQPPDLIGYNEAQFLARYRERTSLSEKVINPASIAYFSILSAINVWQGFSKQQRAYVEGSNRNIGTAYSLAVLITAHEGWCQAAGLAAGATMKKATS